PFAGAGRRPSRDPRRHREPPHRTARHRGAGRSHSGNGTPMSSSACSLAPLDVPLAPRVLDTLGLAALSRLTGDAEKLQATWDALVARATADAADSAAYLDL